MNPVAEGFQRVLAAFDRLDIRYAVGGSMASSLSGNYRQTNNIDILVEMPPDQVEEFTALLGPEFYSDASHMKEAFRHGRPANVIHQRSAFKFDLFPALGRFERSELDRRRFDSVSVFGPEIEFAVTTTEDILLAKLRWLRMTGGSSEQQWRDVTGIVAVQGGRLDRAYLAEWAHELGVADLLARLLSA